MDEPLWIIDETALRIHQSQLDLFGGIAGIRDAGLLSSALARAKNTWAYSSGKADLAAVGAAYAYGLSRNHPFLDGNKRTAAVVCETFLNLNGTILDANNEEGYEVMMSLAAGELSEEDFAQWLRDRLQEADSQ